MRVIVNLDLLYTEAFAKLNDSEIVGLMKILPAFSSKNNSEIDGNKQMLIDLYDINVKTIQKLIDTQFIKFTDTTIQINDKYFKFFKNNAANVRKHRENKKIDKKPVKVNVKKEDVVLEEDTNIDYDNVVRIFNEVFEDTDVTKIEYLTNDKKKMIKHLFLNQKDKVNVNDYEEFFESYFNMCSQRKKLVNGWKDVENDIYLKPGIDFMLRENTFKNVLTQKTKYA